jgi:hypothetical protein
MKLYLPTEDTKRYYSFLPPVMAYDVFLPNEEEHVCIEADLVVATHFATGDHLPVLCDKKYITIMEYEPVDKDYDFKRDMDVHCALNQVLKGYYLATGIFDHLSDKEWQDVSKDSWCDHRQTKGSLFFAPTPYSIRSINGYTEYSLQGSPWGVANPTKVRPRDLSLSWSTNLIGAPLATNRYGGGVWPSPHILSPYFDNFLEAYVNEPPEDFGDIVTTLKGNMGRSVMLRDVRQVGVFDWEVDIVFDRVYFCSFEEPWKHDTLRSNQTTYLRFDGFERDEDGTLLARWFVRAAGNAHVQRQTDIEWNHPVSGSSGKWSKPGFFTYTRAWQDPNPIPGISSYDEVALIKEVEALLGPALESLRVVHFSQTFDEEMELLNKADESDLALWETTFEAIMTTGALLDAMTVGRVMKTFRARKLKDLINSFQSDWRQLRRVDGQHLLYSNIRTPSSDRGRESAFRYLWSRLVVIRRECKDYFRLTGGTPYDSPTTKFSNAVRLAWRKATTDRGVFGGIRSSAGLFLGILFGPVPLHGEIEGLLQTWDDINTTEKVQLRGGSTDSDTITDVTKRDGSEFTFSRKKFVQIIVAPHTKGIDQLFIQLDALGVLPTFKNVWSVVKLSFVIDWFLPIGEILQQIDHIWIRSRLWDLKKRVSSNLLTITPSNIPLHFHGGVKVTRYMRMTSVWWSRPSPIEVTSASKRVLPIAVALMLVFSDIEKE